MPSEGALKKPVGLYAEIVVTIALLTAAALLFSGFLLVNLTQQELVEQRIQSVVGTLETLSQAFSASDPDHEIILANLPLVTASLNGLLSSTSSLDGWGLVDRDLLPQALPSLEGGYQLDMSDLGQVRETGETLIKIRFPSLWIPSSAPEEAFVEVAVAITPRDQFIGALQGRFSLEDVRLRVAAAQHLVLLYTLLYGGVLVAFGAYVMNRNIARPVRRLTKITRQVADGNLEKLLPVAGPREIADFSATFNAMLLALRESRLQTQEHILSLQQANGELRETREELLRSARMASVGHLAAGMAHEIGNPLGATIGYLELLKSELEPGRAQEIVMHALGEAGRIDRLVRDLLDYASPAPEDMEALNPADILRQAYEILLSQGALEGVSCQVDLPDLLPLVLIDRYRLLQVLVNLLLNARDALTTGGSVRLSGREDGARICLVVADDGEGMNTEVKQHLFDPFYTTKPPGKGRGLGLSVCHRIIADAGGLIEVESTLGEGSIFTLCLPKVRSSEI